MKQTLLHKASEKVRVRDATKESQIVDRGYVVVAKIKMTPTRAQRS